MGAILSSDHVNYLIWRYLQERGYGRAAVQLMRDWGVEPQSLDFAATIKPNTLISILQDGLAWDDLLAVSASRDQPPASPAQQTPDTPTDPRRYLFIERRKRRVSEILPNGGDEAVRKRPRLINGSRAVSSEASPEVPQPARSTRRKSSFGMSLVNGDSATADEVDAACEETKPATPEEDVEIPVDEPSPPPISTLETGHNIGVQSEAPTTPVATTLADVLIPGADILHLSWSKQNPAQLLVTGNRVFRTLTFLEQTIPDSSSLKVDSEDHFGYTESRYVVARARTPKQDATAIAFEEGDLHLASWSPVAPGTIPNKTMPESEHRILRSGSGSALILRWNPSASRMLIVDVEESRLTVSVLDVSQCDEDCEKLSLQGMVMDAVWISDTHFLLGGQGFISLYTTVQSLQKLSTLKTTEAWTWLKCDSTIGMTVCASQTESTVALLEVSHTKLNVNTPKEEDGSEQQKETAPSLRITHTTLQAGHMTALKWQPLLDANSSSASPVLPLLVEDQSLAPDTMDVDKPTSPSHPVPAPAPVEDATVLSAASTAPAALEPNSVEEPLSASVETQLKPARELSTASANANAVKSPTAQPPSSQLPPARLFAVSSMDGTVTIYSASAQTGISTLHTFIMGQSPLQMLRSILAHSAITVPALAMSFSPDGRYIAAASEERICVWRATVEGKPACIWDENDDEDSAEDGRARALILAAMDEEVMRKNGEPIVAEIKINGHSAGDTDLEADAEGDVDEMVVDPPIPTLNGDTHQDTLPNQAGQTQPLPIKKSDMQQSAQSSPIRRNDQQVVQSLFPPTPHPDPFHTIAWDLTGTRICFGRGDRLRIIGLDLPRVNTMETKTAATVTASNATTASETVPTLAPAPAEESTIPEAVGVDAMEIIPSELPTQVEAATAPVAMSSAQ